MFYALAFFFKFGVPIASVSLSMKNIRNIDKNFLFIVIAIVVAGFFIFVSASLGVLTREGGLLSLITTQLLAIFLGWVLLVVTLNVPYRFWRKYSLYIFLASILFSLLVFVPGLGIEHGGAKRWIDLGMFTLQPVEFLKLGFVIYFAAWLSGVYKKIHKLQYGLIPFILLILLVGGLLLLQPDMGTLLVVTLTGGIMLIAAGARWRDIFSLVGMAAASVTLLVLTVSYVRARFATFIDPATDVYGAGYQIKQSLIAIGSGGVFGRGLGQSVQKFNFLPEPVSDSIFAVAAEELGLIGGIILVSLFVALALRGLKIAARVKDFFGSILVVGIVSLIVIQSFVNMGSILAVLPLTGMPLIFVSQGGSAFLGALAGVGIVLNVSKKARP